MIPWRRDTGRECSICPGFISAESQYKAVNRTDLVHSLDTEEGAQAEFNGRLSAYEAVRQTGKRNVSKNGSGAASAIAASAFSGLELRQKLGWFWPEDLYFKHKKEKPNKKAVTTLSHQGKTLRGVLLDETHGMPAGVIEVTSLSHTGVTRTGDLADSASAVDRDSYEACVPLWCEVLD
jgi:hypothetical protein